MFPGEMNKTKRLSIDPQIRSAHSGYQDQGQYQDYAQYISFFVFVQCILDQKEKNNFMQHYWNEVLSNSYTKKLIMIEKT